MLASVGGEGIAKLWDPRTGEMLMRLDPTPVADDAAVEEPTNEEQAAQSSVE